MNFFWRFFITLFFWIFFWEDDDFFCAIFFPRYLFRMDQKSLPIGKKLEDIGCPNWTINCPMSISLGYILLCCCPIFWIIVPFFLLASHSWNFWSFFKNKNLIIQKGFFLTRVIFCLLRILFNHIKKVNSYEKTKSVGYEENKIVL